MSLLPVLSKPDISRTRCMKRSYKQLINRIKMVDSFRKGRKLLIKVRFNLSNYGIIEAGVTQGAVLSPQLYSIYTTDIPRRDNIILVQWAEDTAIGTQSLRVNTAINRLQGAAEKIIEWCYQWRIAINKDKSLALIGQGRRYSSAETTYWIFSWKRDQWPGFPALPLTTD